MKYKLTTLTLAIVLAAVATNAAATLCKKCNLIVSDEACPTGGTLEYDQPCGAEQITAGCKNKQKKIFRCGTSNYTYRYEFPESTNAMLNCVPGTLCN